MVREIVTVGTFTVEVQDAGHPSDKEKALRDGLVPVYHTHGLRQYLGTCKYHIRLDCPVLVHWRPGKLLGVGQLGKTVMREWVASYGEIAPYAQCRRCWDAKEGKGNSMNERLRTELEDRHK